MIVLELRFIAQAHHTRDGAKGARARGQDRADEEALDMVPGRGAEAAAERVQDLYNGAWQGQHLLILSVVGQFESWSLPVVCRPPNG